MTNTLQSERPLPTNAPLDGFATALVIAIMFSWGLNQVAIKVAIRGFDPMLMAAGRSALAGLCVFLWCRLHGIPLFAHDGTLAAGMAAGLLFGVEFIMIFMAMDMTSVGRVTLLMNLMPFWVAIGGHFLLGERMSLRAVIGMVIAFIGVYIVFSDRVGRPGPLALYGDIIAICSGFLWGMTSLVIKRSRLVSAPPEKVLLYQLVVASVVPLPLLGAAGPIIRDVNMLSIIAFLFQSLFVTAFTYLLWFWMFRRYSVSKLSNFAFLTPAFGVILSAVLLGEHLSWKMFASLFLIAAGLFVINRPPRKAIVR